MSVAIVVDLNVEEDAEEEREAFVPYTSLDDELEIHTSDGAVLRALVDDPPEGVATRATIVLSHAMFARKTSFGRRDRPGLSSALQAKGFRTVAFDFRGHGDSKAPEKNWGYDDLVRVDLPAVFDCVSARADDKPVIIVGHSLGGHVALAAQGTGLIKADAIVMLGANVWLRDLEPSRVRWAAKIAFAKAMLSVSKRMNGIPARRLRIGSDDAPPRYLDDLFSTVRTNRWASNRGGNGGEDYFASLSNVTVPVASVLGGRDRIMCHPKSGEAFARRCTSADVRIFHARRADHVELVTSTHARSVVIDAVEWAALARATTRATGSGPP